MLGLAAAASAVAAVAAAEAAAAVVVAVAAVAFAREASDSTTAHLVWAIFAAAICCASTVILAHIDCIAAEFALSQCHATVA